MRVEIALSVLRGQRSLCMRGPKRSEVLYI